MCAEASVVNYVHCAVPEDIIPMSIEPQISKIEKTRRSVNTASVCQVESSKKKKMIIIIQISFLCLTDHHPVVQAVFCISTSVMWMLLDVPLLCTRRSQDVQRPVTPSHPNTPRAAFCEFNSGFGVCGVDAVGVRCKDVPLQQVEHFRRPDSGLPVPRPPRANVWAAAVVWVLAVAPFFFFLFSCVPKAFPLATLVPRVPGADTGTTVTAFQRHSSSTLKCLADLTAAIRNTLWCSLTTTTKKLTQNKWL